jgi:CRISPR-associated protein Cas2
MWCLVVYDITDDNKRNKVADVCVDYGLDRIQYSAFLGDLTPTHQEELMLKIAAILKRRTGKASEERCRHEVVEERCHSEASDEGCRHEASKERRLAEASKERRLTEASVLLVPVCEKDWNARRMIEQKEAAAKGETDAG